MLLLLYSPAPAKDAHERDSKDSKWTIRAIGLQDISKASVDCKNVEVKGPVNTTDTTSTTNG